MLKGIPVRAGRFVPSVYGGGESLGLFSEARDAFRRSRGMRRINSHTSFRRPPTGPTFVWLKNGAMESHQSHEWIRQFCVQLLRSRPDLPGKFVVAKAIATYPIAAELHPDEAARLLAAALSPRLNGMTTRRRSP